MAQLKFVASGFQQIDPEQIVGNFAEVTKGYAPKIGSTKDADTGKTVGYWCNLRNDKDETLLVTASRNITKTLNEALEGVTDQAARQGIVLAAFNQSTIVEVPKYKPAGPGQTRGDIAKDELGNPVMQYKASSRTEALSAPQIAAVTAKAASFSLKAAMSNRV